MSLTQELEDPCEEIGSKIILTTNMLEEDLSQNLSSTSTNKTFNYPQTFLRVGKPGKLFLKPNYTAFTKTNLGSIPSKVEKTLIKTEENIPITVTLNKQVQKINLTQGKENDKRNFSTSYSSKGYGVGFVSKVPRFDYSQRIIYPGPGDYSPEKNDSVENNVNKSILGKSLFSEKSNKSLQLLNTNKDKFYTSQEILSLLRKNYNERYNILDKNNVDNNKNSNNIKNENKKGNYYFESKVKKFNRGIFNTYNKNPGPGKYFIDTNYKIKNKEKKSPDFIEPLITKREDPLKTFGITSDDENRIGFNFSSKKGKIANLWNGSPFMGYSYDFGKTLKNIKDNKTTMNLKRNKIISLPDTDMSNNLKNLGKFRSKFLFNDFFNNITKDNIENQYNNINCKTKMKKDLIKYKKKDLFALASPRWDEGHFHDNASHFQIPGPAYYQPKEQLLKRSFNLNKKDFIFTNSVPFLEKKYTDC